MEIYLDESGNLGGIGPHTSKSDPYFVLAALIVNDGLPIKRCIKDIRHKRIKKRYKKISELKFSESDDDIKRRILECIGRTDNDIGYAVLSKAVVYQRSVLHQNTPGDSIQLIYNDICKQLVYRIITDYQVRGRVDIMIDKSLYGSKRAKFDRCLVNKTGMLVPDHLGEIRVFHVDSRQCPCIQAVDFVAGAISRKYRDNDDSYYQKIQQRISVQLNI